MEIQRRNGNEKDSCTHNGVRTYADMLCICKLRRASLTWRGPTGDWARETVDTLAEQGIIKGYSDGTYQPNNSVTNQEAFTLFARIVGVNDAINADAVAAAQEEYKDVAAKYNTYATKELCYMLYRGIFTQAEIDTYLGEATKIMS